MTTAALLPYPPRPRFVAGWDDDDAIYSILDAWRQDCSDIWLANFHAGHAGPRIIGYCYPFDSDDDQPRDCGPHCGSCNAAREAGLAVGETMKATP